MAITDPFPVPPPEKYTTEYDPTTGETTVTMTNDAFAQYDSNTGIYTSGTVTIDPQSWGSTSNITIWPPDEPARYTCYLCEVEFTTEDVDDEGSTPNFCGLCRAALMEVRKKYIADTMKIIGIETNEREGKVSFHQGFTKTGNLIHAVALVKRGKYEPRAACGVRISEAKARKFEQVEKGSECKRCQESLAAA